MSENYWIVTSHSFVEHPRLDIAEKERARLSAKEPSRTFTVRRCKRTVASDTDTLVYVRQLEARVKDLEERLGEHAVVNDQSGSESTNG